MIHRFPYYIYLATALAFVVLKWRTLPRELHLAKSGNADAYLPLAWLVLVLAFAVVVILHLRRERRSNRHAHSQDSLHYHGDSLSLRELPTTWRGAIVRRPMLASASFLLIIAIPILWVAFSHPGGLWAFGMREWILVGTMELPVAGVIAATLMSILLRRK